MVHAHAFRPYIEGLATWTGYAGAARNGSTVEEVARYSYSVWLRHLVVAGEAGMDGVPSTLAEIGPGGSLGVGYAALLSGASTYHACDVSAKLDATKESLVLESLRESFVERRSIPGDDAFPRLHPKLRRYDFPSGLVESLPSQVDDAAARIRSSLCKGSFAGGPIRYLGDTSAGELSKQLEPATVDMVVSQAVMEYVPELTEAYGAMERVMRPGAFMSHQIDFGAHQTSPDWDGHWRYNALSWRMIRGRRQHFLTRLPFSSHVDAILDSGMEILDVRPVHERPTHTRRPGQRCEQDLSTRATLIVARKRRNS